MSGAFKRELRPIELRAPDKHVVGAVGRDDKDACAAVGERLGNGRKHSDFREVEWTFDTQAGPIA